MKNSFHMENYNNEDEEFDNYYKLQSVQDSKKIESKFSTSDQESTSSLSQNTKQRRSRQERRQIQAESLHEGKNQDQEVEILKEERGLEEYQAIVEPAIEQHDEEPSTCIQNNHQGEQQDLYSHQNIARQKLEEEEKGKLLDELNLRNTISQASQNEILVPTQKDMGMREYIKNYKESKLNDFLPKGSPIAYSEFSNNSYINYSKQEMFPLRPTINSANNRYSNFSNGIILNSSSNTPFETPDKSRTSRIDVKVSEKRHNLNLDPSANHYSSCRDSYYVRTKSVTKLSKASSINKFSTNQK